MAKASVSASWQADKLVITSTEPYGGMPGNVSGDRHGRVVALAGRENPDQNYNSKLTGYNKHLSTGL